MTNTNTAAAKSTTKITDEEGSKIAAIGQARIDAFFGDSWAIDHLTSDASKDGIRYEFARQTARRILACVAAECQCGDPLDHEPGDCPAVMSPAAMLEIASEELHAQARQYTASLARDARHRERSAAELADSAIMFVSALADVAGKSIPIDTFKAINVTVRNAFPYPPRTNG